MATLAISNAETLANIALVLGISRTPSEWDSEVTADVNRIIRSGRRKFFMSNSWQFLQQDYSILTEAPLIITSGTIINGVLTIGGLPADPVGNYKVVPNTTGGIYDIASTVAGVSITLTNTSINSAAAEKITLYRYRYPLPANFGAFLDPVVVENWSDVTQLREYNTIPYFETLGIINRNLFQTGPPEIFAVNSEPVLDGSGASESGTYTYFFYLYPLVDARYVIRMRFTVQPGDTLTLSTSADTIHSVFSELMEEAILSSAEIMYLRAPGVHTAMFAQLLPAAIKKDKEMDGTRRLLPRRKQRRLDNAQIRTASVTIRDENNNVIISV